MPHFACSRRLVWALVLAVAMVAGACGDDDAVDSVLSPSPTEGSGTAVTPAPGVPAAPTESSATVPETAAGTEPAGPSQDFAGLELALTPVITVSEPMALAFHPDYDDLWIAERQGRVRQVVRTREEGRGVERVRLLTEPVLDLSDQITTEGEGGLLGLVFAPDGSALYVHYTDRQGDTVVAEYPVTAGGDGLTVDGSAARQLLTVDQPYSNHNGGDLLFGPDGMLYVALGDGGGGGDPELTGQDPTDMLGSVLRIDPRPDGTSPYTIPADNPFADGTGGAPEVWLWGARNPWRVSFDSLTGDFWVADVGQNAVEEIDFLPAAEGAGRGANLGWNLMEGDDAFAGDPPADHVGPIATYRHDGNRCSVTGGYVYRGSSIPDFDGVYVFGDYCSGEIFGLEGAGTGSTRVAPLNLDRLANAVTAFGQDPGGEVYVLQQEGQVSLLSPRTGGPVFEVVADSG